MTTRMQAHDFSRILEDAPFDPVVKSLLPKIEKFLKLQPSDDYIKVLMELHRMDCALTDGKIKLSPTEADLITRIAMGFSVLAGLARAQERS